MVDLEHWGMGGRIFEWMYLKTPVSYILIMLKKLVDIVILVDFAQFTWLIQQKCELCVYELWKLLQLDFNAYDKRNTDY